MKNLSYKSKIVHKYLHMNSHTVADSVNEDNP